MGMLTRMSNGWQLAISSVKVLNANKQLIVFPIMSGLSMLAVIAGSGFFLFRNSRVMDTFSEMNNGMIYLVLLGYYVINYFIIVFFNVGLIHCTKLYFDGEEAAVSKGLQFAAGRTHIIFLWAMLSATVGVLLNFLQDNLGWAGKIITAGLGVVWSVATFMVTPVLAYENVGPVEAVKRSAQLMKEKWGEGVGASFSFGVMILAVFFPFGIIAYGVSYYVSDEAGIAVFAIGMLLIFTISGALRSILLSALYNNIKGNIDDHFTQRSLDGLFEAR